MKSVLPTFICGRYIVRSLTSTEPTLGVTSLKEVDLNLLSLPTFGVTYKF